jgi:capsule polysaccharide export protein KpsE/RkpR
MKENIETLQEEKVQLTTQLYEVQAVLENNPTVTPFKLESDGSNN